MKSKSVSVNVTANGLAANQAQQTAGSAKSVAHEARALANGAQKTAGSAQSVAQEAQALANGAQKTADGKNSVYRGSDPNTVPPTGLKDGDIYFTDNALWTWNGSAWKKTVSDTTGAEIHEKVNEAIEESKKAAADLESRIKDTAAELDREIAKNKIQTGNALSFYKEQYYLSASYTELTGGSWSDDVPEKTAGKYVWSRYVTANIGDSTHQQYSSPVCISGLDGAQGPQGLRGLQGPQGDQGIQGPQGLSSYTHIAYATSADGRNGFDVSTSVGKTYIGIYCDSNSADSMEPARYNWSLIKGERGDQGIPGTKGADGQTPYFHVAYANSSDGAMGFDVSNSDGKIYIGQYTDYTQADSTNPASYSWTKIKGETGATGATGPQGPKGDEGVPGSKGADGQTAYVHVAYANSADGSANFNVNYFSDALYIGVLTDHTQADSTDHTQYTWSKLKGDRGDQGVPGPKGTDGQTSYVHFAYANITNLGGWGARFTLSPQTVVRWGNELLGKWIYKNLPGGSYTAINDTFGGDPAPWQYKEGQAFSDFSVSESNGRAYIGQYTDYKQDDSTDPASYSWTKIKGETGNTGATGPQGADGTDAPTITVKSYTFSAVNGARADIELTGPNAFKQTVRNRGHNVWVLDAKTHQLREFVSCDTFISMSFSHNGANMTLADYLTGLTDSIVVIAAADADTIDQNTRNVLNNMGGSPDFGTWGGPWMGRRFGHVFIGMSKRSDGTWPLQPRQGYEEVIQKDGSAPEIGCALSNGGIVANGAIGPQGPQGETGSTGFFIGTTPPPNPTKGTVWATNDSSGNMNSAKTWNGSDWVSTAFTQDLVAGNITATKIVGGELDVDKITIKNAQNIPVTSTVSLGDKLSSIEHDADGLSATVIGGGNLLNNTSDTLQSVTVNDWVRYTTSSDEPISKHQLDGQTVTLSAWIENPSKEAWVQMYTDKGTWFQGNKIPAGGSGWSQVTYTMPSGFTYWNIVIGCGDGSGTVTLSYSSLQLEIGPNRTAWSQSTADIALLKLTANNLDAYITRSSGSDHLKALLHMDPNNSSIAQLVNGNPVAAINLSEEGDIKIDSKRLYITSDTRIDQATIKSAMIDSIDASQIKSGVIDASLIRVINLDAGSITTGKLSAQVADGLNLNSFKPYTVSASSPWDFNETKSVDGNWFLVGETTADHFYNGPCYNNNKSTPLTPYVYVTSRGSADGKNFTVTVWKDNDPTQYQRVWNGSAGYWTDWVMLPNSQNLVSAINLSPDSVKISGKHIELNGDTSIRGQLNLLPKDQREVDQNNQGFHNPWHWRDSTVYAGSGGLQLQSTIDSLKYSNDDTSIGGLRRGSSAAITTLAPTYLKFTVYPSWNDVNNNFSNQLCRTYIDAGRIETGDVWAGNLRIVGHHIRVPDGKFLLVSNRAGTNFDNNGSVGLQVYGGVGLGQNTIYMPSRDLYIQQGNVVQTMGQSYSSASKITLHAQKLVSQEANTVSSRLSVKTAITKVSYDRALMAVQNTDMYDYRYISDDSGQHYVSGIIDDIHDNPEYNMDPMLINKERTARIDANLLGYHQVVLQEILKRLDKLEAK